MIRGTFLEATEFRSKKKYLLNTAHIELITAGDQGGCNVRMVNGGSNLYCLEESFVKVAEALRVIGLNR